MSWKMKHDGWDVALWGLCADRRGRFEAMWKMKKMSVRLAATMFCMCLPAMSCNAKSPPMSRDAKPARSTASECTPLLEGDTESIRLISQGSHARAQVDVRIDLRKTEMTGSTFRLEADDVKTVPVHRKLKTSELDPLVHYLRSVCLPLRKASEKQFSAPGGETRYEVTDGKGNTRILKHQSGATNIPQGAEYFELSDDVWKDLEKLWPSI